MPEESKANQHPWEEPDWFLVLIVSLANNGLEIGITLQVGGFLVSGTLVSGDVYFEGFASDFSPVNESVRKAIAEAGEPYKKARETEAGETDEGLHIEYVHLKDARFFNTYGNPIPGNKGVWWRGRLSKVSGFILGTLSAVQS